LSRSSLITKASTAVAPFILHKFKVMTTKTQEAASPQRPLPCYDGPYQPGIADPLWPCKRPEYLDNDADVRRYNSDQAGRVDAQNWLTAIFLNVNVSDKAGLKKLLEEISAYARFEMLKPPGRSDLEIWTPAPPTRRVTVTIGFGLSLFISPQGDDRFNIRHKKPKWLKEMRRSEVDSFDPSEYATDFVIIVASDADQVNDAILMALKDGYWPSGQGGTCDRRLEFKRAVSGYQRLDNRDYLRVADGANNLSNAKSPEIDELVFIKPHDREPGWCLNGSYLLWKEIELDRPKFDSLTKDEKSHVIGRDVDTGAEMPFGGHIKKVQPRRKGVDFMGIADLDRRFLRRGYIYVSKGESIAAGRLFFSYMRSLEKQGEWTVDLWQSDEKFPTDGAGVDPLFASNVARSISGGHYFCPPNVAEGDFIGSGLFD
jgi:deferrochelatase/peroxidase EfeB